MAQTTILQTPDGEMELFDAEPARAARGGVVVIQDIFGLNDYLRDVCGRLATEGYRAVAPQLYHRNGVKALEYAPAEIVVRNSPVLTSQGVLSDIASSLEYLRSAGFEARRTAIIGFCLGGTLAFAAAVEHSLGAAVTFYGGGIREGRRGFAPLEELAPKLKTPWLGLYGDRDLPSEYGHGIPVVEVEALRAAALLAPVETEVVRYPEAGHAFHCDRRPTYHEGSAKDAWQRTLEWLGTHMGVEDQGE